MELNSCLWYELEKKRLSKMKTKIVGVPEHFNLPWHLSIEKAILKPIDLQWTDIPEGTENVSNAT
jgi:hypothetical protein